MGQEPSLSTDGLALQGPAEKEPLSDRVVT